MTKNTNNNKKTIGIVLASSAAVGVLTAGLIFGTAGFSAKQPQTVSSEQKEEQTVKGTVKSVDGKKVTITIGEKTYTFENNKEDLKLQKGDKVSVVLVKDAEGKEQVKSVKLLPAEAEGEKAVDETVETASEQ